MSRQTDRHTARAEQKLALSAAKVDSRKEAQRERLNRQTVREKAGAYTGRGVAAAVAESKSRITKRRVKKGNAFARIIITQVFGDREVSYHATKGWRSHRAS